MTKGNYEKCTVNVVKEIAGNKSITTTIGYSHVRSEDMKQAVKSLNY
ncbi:MAG: hypothetical protein KBF96_03430 [Ignavibacteria bacterium]|jgi:site-specific recombinase XerD|nr:hypothetical protein [Ignavibacteria bacterium]